MLNPYQAEKFPHLEKSIKDGQWYAIKPDRPDLAEFIECIKLFIDYYGNLEFNEDYSAFRRAYPLGTLKWLVENDNSATEKMIKDLHDKTEAELEAKHPTPAWKKRK